MNGSQQLPPGLARAMGRGDLARPQVRTTGTGVGAAYFGKGSTSTGPHEQANGTAVGLSQSANLGQTLKEAVNVNVSTGVSSTALIGGLVLVLVAFHIWTRGHAG